MFAGSRVTLVRRGSDSKNTGQNLLGDVPVGLTGTLRWLSLGENILDGSAVRRGGGKQGGKQRYRIPTGGSHGTSSGRPPSQ